MMFGERRGGGGTGLCRESVGDGGGIDGDWELGE